MYVDMDENAHHESNLYTTNGKAQEWNLYSIPKKFPKFTGSYFFKMPLNFSADSKEGSN